MSTHPWPGFPKWLLTSGSRAERWEDSGTHYFTNGHVILRTPEPVEGAAELSRAQAWGATSYLRDASYVVAEPSSAYLPEDDGSHAGHYAVDLGPCVAQARYIAVVERLHGPVEWRVSGPKDPIHAVLHDRPGGGERLAVALVMPVGGVPRTPAAPRAMTTADRAVSYVLARAQEDADLGHLIGPFTESFKLLCAAEAERTGEALDDVEARRGTSHARAPRHFLSASEHEAEAEKGAGRKRR